MSVENQWDLVRRGYVGDGLAVMQESFNETPTPSTLVTLGLGYLWAEKYEAVCNHFHNWMHRYGVTADAYFALVGAAQWCLDDALAACESWKLGLRAQYLDMAGGIGAPLLLWSATVLRPNPTLRKEAVQILEEKTRNPKVRHWPGPLAEFVLSQIDETTLNKRSIERGEIRPRRKWLIAFYKHILALDRGGLSLNGFKKEVQELVDTSASGWSKEEDFLQLVRNPEFYIARHEASAGSVSVGNADGRTRTC